MKNLIFIILAVWVPVFAYAATYTATWNASPTATNYKLYGGDSGQTALLGETDQLTVTGNVDLQTTVAEFYVEACNVAGCTPSQHVFKQRVIAPPAATQLQGVTLDWSN